MADERTMTIMRKFARKIMRLRGRKLAEGDVIKSSDKKSWLEMEPAFSNGLVSKIP
jgi:hypothetical protein